MAKRQNPNGLKDIAKRMGEVETQVGFFPSARYEDGTPVAAVAAYNEFGTPSRSFFRTTISAEKKSWAGIIRDGSKLVITGQMDLADVMEGVGLQASGDIRKKIASITQPPLKPATLKARERRGNTSTKPLVDKRIMINSVNHIVEEK